MTVSSKKNRIIFIDLMRALAVLQMVQGHTTDVLLSPVYRNPEYPVYSIWLFMRGLTAPIFLFTAGTVFTYLFKLNNKSFHDNPRVHKGFKRVLLLVTIGYLLRYPTPSITNFANVTQSQWDIFFTVDVLHLIGISLLFVIILEYIIEKLKLNDYVVFGISVLVFFLATSYITKINWISFLPQVIAAYFYTGVDSIFPLFPWSGYVIAGGLLGSYLAKHPMVFKTYKFSYMLGIAGLAFVALAFLIKFAEQEILGYYRTMNTAPFLIILRLGLVLILNSIVSLISIKIEHIPRFLILVGRNTLLIYVIHLVILYGSAWNFGINQVYGKSFDVWQTVGSALLMLGLMTVMVLVIHYLKIRNKELVT